MLLIQLKKTDYNTKVTEIENKLNNNNHDKYIDILEFNKLAADVINARLAQANLITKTDFDAKLSSLNRKITQNKSKHLLVENELNKLKIWIQVTLLEKVILKKMVLKFIQYFSRFIDILKRFLLHSILNMFQNGNLKDYLMKVLRRFLRLIIALIQH